LAGLCLREAIEVKDTEVRRSTVAGLLKVRTRGEITKNTQMISPDVEDYLIRWAKGIHWYENAAISSLLETNDYERVLVALQDQQSIVRGAALAAFTQLPPQVASDELIAKIITVTTDDKDANTRVAVEALGLWKTASTK
jgi:hypothetical protein